MSVMQIPTSCYLCESCIDKNAEIEGTKASYICERTGSIIHAYAEGERPRIDAKTGRIPECPLVEEQPHGRLIDADVLKAKLRLGVLIASFKGRYKQMADVLIDEICSAIDESPTIIEGSTCWSCRERTDSDRG